MENVILTAVKFYQLNDELKKIKNQFIKQMRYEEAAKLRSIERDLNEHIENLTTAMQDTIQRLAKLKEEWEEQV